jgi:hypothetical protein
MSAKSSMQKVIMSDSVTDIVRTILGIWIHIFTFWNTKYHILIRSNKMQQYAGIYFCKIILHISGVNRTHHQEYIKLTAASGTATTFLQRGQILPPTWPDLATLEEGFCSDTMTCTRGCSYSFMYS